ncbi:MAG: peptidoglycan DD-metalloendopeptidase family protein [Acidobacteria bacterium]|nr:peptidoglycan DD-metalloendopeptidase family protein [Acidobacteriota bacterium]
MASVEDVNEAPRVVALADAVAEHQAQVVEAHRQMQEDTTRLEEAAQAAKAATAIERDHVAARKRQLETDRADLGAAQADAQSEAAEEERLLAKVRANRDEDERRIAQLQRESAEIAALLRRRQSGQGITPGGKGVLAAPVAYPVITSTFGYRVHPIYGDVRLHTGVDFRGSTGTPILAAGSGTVVFAGVRSGYGNTVVIDHGGSLATLYAHQSAISVTNGETVRRGQVIGAVGSTGLSTGPHLHFEVRVDGTPVDPLGYL